MFHCGYGQEIEAYITYRLMDDPSLNVDAMIDEYFSRLYGPAAGPLREFYETVEQAYGNPGNYPEGVATGQIEGHHHQTEEVAWGYLGNAQRLATLGKLMAEAHAVAETDDQKRRVALFELAVWDYLTAGRAPYIERLKAGIRNDVVSRRVPFAARGPFPHLAAVDWAEALALTGWRSASGEPTQRKVAARVINDGRHCYLQFEEHTSLVLPSTADLTAGDNWQILFASATIPLRTLLINAAGESSLDGKACSFPVVVERGAGGWTTSVAVPLVDLGVTADARLRLNVIRGSRLSDDQPMWSPSLGDSPTRRRWASCGSIQPPACRRRPLRRTSCGSSTPAAWSPVGVSPKAAARRSARRTACRRAR